MAIVLLFGVTYLFFFTLKCYKVSEAHTEQKYFYPPTRQSFNGISHNMRSDEKSHIFCLNVSQVNVRETSSLQVFPCCSGDYASIPKKEPQMFKHMLEEVYPSWWIWNDVFQKVEGPSLRCRAKKKHDSSNEAI